MAPFRQKLVSSPLSRLLGVVVPYHLSIPATDRLLAVTLTAITPHAEVQL